MDKSNDEISTTPNVITHGQARPDLSEIWINKDCNHELRFVTLWHETLHNIADAYGVKISECGIAALASGIAQVLQDNPEMNWTDYDAARE